MKKLIINFLTILVAIFGVSIFGGTCNAYADVNGGGLVFKQNYTFAGGNTGVYRYDICLEKSGCIKFNFISKEDTNSKMGLCLYKQDGTTDMGYFIFPNAGSGSYSIDLKKGNYVAVFNLGGGSSIYTGNSPIAGTMNASFVEAGETFEEDELTTNDEAGVASEIASVASVDITGQLALNDKVDYYTFELGKDKLVNISEVSGMNNLEIHLYAEDLSSEVRETNIGSGSHKYSYALKEGQYILAIENKDTKSTGTYKLSIRTEDLKVAQLKSVKENGFKAIQVNWKKVSGSDGYIIQVSTDPKFEKNTKNYTITGSSKKISGLKSNKKYYVRIKSIKYTPDGKDICSSKWSSSRSVTTK